MLVRETKDNGKEITQVHYILMKVEEVHYILMNVGYREIWNESTKNFLWRHSK